jgi:hypothetical protein
MISGKAVDTLGLVTDISAVDTGTRSKLRSVLAKPRQVAGRHIPHAEPVRMRVREGGDI